MFQIDSRVGHTLLSVTIIPALIQTLPIWKWKSERKVNMSIQINIFSKWIVLSICLQLCIFRIWWWIWIQKDWVNNREMDPGTDCCWFEESPAKKHRKHCGKSKSVFCWDSSFWWASDGSKLGKMFSLKKFHIFLNCY